METEEQPMKQPMRNRGRCFTTLLAALALCGSFSVLAQEGFPLNGSWSGERQVNGKASRVLLNMELNRDQSVTGFVIENGKRQPLQNVKLHPENWTVSFALDGGYQVEAKIEDLGSTSARKIVGKWSQGKDSGNFNVELN
jgi:hypothetical protein